MGSTVPDLRGLFLRGHGSQAHAQNNGSIVGITTTQHHSGQLGQVHGDAARRVRGDWQFEAQGSYVGEAAYHTTPLWNANFSGSGPTQTLGSIMALDSSRVTPTAPENRPVNMAVRYLIRAAR